jgi:hypothetical protein
MPLKYHFKFTIFLISDVSLSENEIDNNRIANSVLHIGTDFTKAFFAFKVSSSRYMCKYNFIYGHGESMAFTAKIFMIQEHNMQNNRKQSKALSVPIFVKFTITK